MSENNNSLVNDDSSGKRGPREKILSAVAYILSLPGALIAGIAGRESGFCRHHARRSLELFLFMAFLLVLWFIIMYLLVIIPYAGFPLAVALFGIVVAAALFSLALCIMGIVKALQGKNVAFPFVTSMVHKIEPFFRLIGLPEE